MKTNEEMNVTLVDELGFSVPTFERKFNAIRANVMTGFEAMTAEVIEQGLARLNGEGQAKFVNVSVQMEQFCLPLVDVLEDKKEMEEVDFYVEFAKLVAGKVETYQKLMAASSDDLDPMGLAIKEMGVRGYDDLKAHETELFRSVEAQLALSEDLLKELSAEAEKAGVQLDAVLNRMLGVQMAVSYVSFRSATGVN